MYKKDSYTIGNLYVDGKYICNTLEDKDRGLTQSMSLDTIASIKVPSKTAIPTGTYVIAMNITSPKLSKERNYKQINGKVPRLLNVPGYDGVLIHIGNTEADSSGCILVGYNKVVGKVINSTSAFYKLDPLLQQAADNHELITITIQ